MTAPLRLTCKHIGNQPYIHGFCPYCEGTPDPQLKEMREQIANARKTLERIGDGDKNQLSSLIALSEEMIAERGAYDWRTVTVVRGLTYFWTDCSRRERELRTVRTGFVQKGHVPGY